MREQNQLRRTCVWSVASDFSLYSNGSSSVPFKRKCAVDEPENEINARTTSKRLRCDHTSLPQKWQWVSVRGRTPTVSVLRHCESYCENVDAHAPLVQCIDRESHTNKTCHCKNERPAGEKAKSGPRAFRHHVEQRDHRKGFLLVRARNPDCDLPSPKVN